MNAVPEEPDEGQTVRISEAASRLGVHQNTIRNAIKKGRLHAEKQPGQWGRDEYAITLEDLAEFAQRQYGKSLDIIDGLVAEKHDHDERTAELYERIITLQNELTQTKAICAVNESLESHYKDQIAELVHERNAATERVIALTEELAEEKNKKGWFRRLF